ncbi:MAG: methyl-accepting chemotaxis protein [Bacteroidota bacterium]
MSRMKTPYLAGLLTVMSLLAAFAAVKAPPWVRVLANMPCVIMAVWWIAAQRTECIRLEARLAAQAKQARDERDGLEAMTRSLLGTLEQCATLVPPIGECGDLQRQIDASAASLLEDAALVQEDLVELEARIKAFLDAEGPALEKAARELSALAKVNEAKVAAVSEAMAKLLADLGRQGEDLLVRQASLSTTTETCLTTFAAVGEAVAAGETALADWRHPFVNIGQAVQIATDLAEQARILGVNASIEALRSGEAGRGFMLVAEEAERISERMVRVVHQVAAQVEEGEIAANKLGEAFMKAKTHLTRGGETGRQLVDLIGGLSQPVREISLAEASDLPERLRELSAGTGLLCDRLAESLRQLDPRVAEEGRGAAARLFGEIEKLVASLKAFEAKFGDLEAGLRGAEATVSAAVAAGRELVDTAAGLENRLDKHGGR